MGGRDPSEVQRGGVRVADPVVQRLKQLEEYVELLEGLRGEDLSEPYRKAALERYFQLAAEASLDVGEMVIAREGLPKPETYRGILQVLGDEGILPEAFAERFEDVAGFRNVLVHDYTRIREEELVANLERLEDFRTFADHILNRRT